MEILQPVLDFRYASGAGVAPEAFPAARLPVASPALFADREYLHKVRDGNVFLHNAETGEESLYLSNSTFVRYG